VVEPICVKKPTQTDAVNEGVCDGFSQKLFKAAMRQKRVSVTGAYVEDEEHGWREIHPVTSIALSSE
jgi:hypothetical protein